MERLQPRDVQSWHWGVEGALSVSQGNSDYVDLLGGFVVGHRWSRDWIRLFTGLDYRTEDGDLVDSNRYLHLRYNRWLSERWQTFHFAQLQASHAELLQRRTLLGSGVRRRLVDGATTLDVGTGAMFESEDLDPDREVGDHPVEARTWRMANLIVLTQPLTESVRLIGVAYVQPDFADFGDLRTLVDASLRISLTENVDLTVQNEWRHDSRPPEGVEEDDFVLSTGFAVSFR
ncbi:MAG: DUF481 domain-containing protein [Candidatus Palauibacterales bacterium]|nr:DUF481 domain-containing protein [Candidatus Palauibacterales bacterium]